MKKKTVFTLTSFLFLATSSLIGCSTPGGGEEPASDGPFTIKFVNYDGEILQYNSGVEKGSTVSYLGNKPVHFDDASNYYVFSGWDKEVAAATKDETYTAVFASHPLDSVTPNPDGYVDVLPLDTKDGATLHAFCWTFDQIREQLPYIAKAGYKSVQTLPVQTPKSSGSSWWAYYQPLGFQIAAESPLGTKEDLEALCDAAEDYNISIIVDVVFNHMANIADGELEPDDTPKVSPLVEQYEPYIYQHRNDTENPTFHHNKNATGSGKETQYYVWGDLPDLNTANEYVQGRCLDFLKECIDVGVDGFRFDAAKHIETSQDPDYPSNFWENTLGVAEIYYQQKTGKELFSYGEVLDKPTRRNISVYTDLMSVNDETYKAGLLDGVKHHKGSEMVSASYRVGADPTKLVNWLESHDSYTESSLDLSNKLMTKAWAALASRKDTHGLYLARTDNVYKDGAKQHSIGVIGDYFFRDESIGAVNRFHNRFLGANEEQNSDGTIYYNERWTNTDKGAVVVSNGTESKIVVDFAHLGTGVYYDQLTGKAVTVRNGHATIELDASGISVLTKSDNGANPQLDIDKRDGLFVDTLDIVVKPTNADTVCRYSINGGDPIELNNNKSKRITISRSQAVNDKVTLEFYLQNGNNVFTESYTYRVAELIPGHFNVLNVSDERINDYDIYMWNWGTNNPGIWSQNFTIQDNTILIDVDSTWTGFVLASFPKNYVITDVTQWDPGVLKQTTDISGAVLAQGYYDASNF